MKKKTTPVLFVLLLAGLIAVIGIAVFAVGGGALSGEQMDLNDYFGIRSDDEVALITDEGISEETGRIIDGEVYLPYDKVSEDISGSIFYDQGTGTVIVTTPTDKMRFDAANEIRVVDDVTYVALGLVTDYSNAEITSYENPARVVARTAFRYLTEAVEKDACICYNPGRKSKTLKKLCRGTSVRVLDVKEDGSAGHDKAEGWTMVQTEDGLRGYIEDKYLDGNVVQTEKEPVNKLGEYTHILHEGRINMAYHQVTSRMTNTYLAQTLQNVTGVNVIAPTWFFLDSAAGDQTNLSDAAYVETAHGLGMQVWAVMNDFDGAMNSGDATMQALMNDSVRERLVADTVASVQAAGADGINIDYENVTEECAPCFLQFIREMSIACRNAGLVLSVCDYVPTYTEHLNRREQARVADYIICMCYDEHRSGSPEAGSVSSLPFVKKGIEDTLEEIPNTQTIIAIPFYTRLWMTTSQDAPDSKALGMADALAWVNERGLEINWENDAAQNYVELQDGNIYYQMWLEDAASIEEKMKLIESADCRGVAEWKLGFETGDVWGVISSHLS